MTVTGCEVLLVPVYVQQRTWVRSPKALRSAGIRACNEATSPRRTDRPGRRASSGPTAQRGTSGTRTLCQRCRRALRRTERNDQMSWVTPPCDLIHDLPPLAETQACALFFSTWLFAAVACSRSATDTPERLYHSRDTTRSRSPLGAAGASSIEKPQDTRSRLCIHIGCVSTLVSGASPYCIDMTRR